MNRRDALCLVGATATGLCVPQILAAAAPRGAATPRGAPARQPELVLNTFHVSKADPGSQVETSQYCTRLNEDVLQCVIFHGTGPKLLGVEYVITDRLYRQLPLEEKAYWHPHAYEVIAGQLIAPDLPPEREDELLRGLVTTWGKGWQTWPDPSANLPEGAPELMWSVTGDGQLRPGLLEDRDRCFGVATRANRARRQRLGYPVPQVAPPESAREVGRPWAGTEGARPGRA